MRNQQKSIEINKKSIKNLYKSREIAEKSIRNRQEINDIKRHRSEIHKKSTESAETKWKSIRNQQKPIINQ